jgi:hypothetical protein
MLTDLYAYGARLPLWHFFSELTAGRLSTAFRSRILALLRR